MRMLPVVGECDFMLGESGRAEYGAQLEDVPESERGDAKAWWS
jgi:hypothetical protein